MKRREAKEGEGRLDEVRVEGKGGEVYEGRQEGGGVR